MKAVWIIGVMLLLLVSSIVEAKKPEQNAVVLTAEIEGYRGVIDLESGAPFKWSK